jgi:mannonate dehydratase
MYSARRRWLAAALAGAGAAAFAGWRFWPDEGLFHPCLEPLPAGLAAHPLVREAWAGLDPSRVWDCHAHLFAAGSGGGIADGRGSLLRPLVAAQHLFFRNAVCAGPDAGAEAFAGAYLLRLDALLAAMPPGFKVLLLALDARHDESGRALPEASHVWTGNDYCARVAAARPERVEWAASVHPYRADAAEELARVQALGARAVKWIPAAQGIDPGAARCDRFYQALAAGGLPLVTHAGAERAAPGDDELGNPLRLRRALEHGVRVVVAHCASMGEGRDLDRGPAGPWVENFALFERLMDEPRHQGRLYGDLSALPQSARSGAPLRRILERGREGGDWSARLLSGSDYPLPAIMPLYSPRDLAAGGLLDPAAVEPLKAIRRHNPLLFDFVIKRHLALEGRRLAAAVFETRRFFTGT